MQGRVPEGVEQSGYSGSREAGGGRASGCRMGPGPAYRIGTFWRAPVQSVRSESRGVGMSIPTLHRATRSRWMDWKPKPRILADAAESEPTKPSKPGSVGFEGATSAESPEIGAEPDSAELARASAVLNRAGVRIMALE